MNRLRLTRDANEDLQSIRDYIAKDNPTPAERYIERIEARMDLICAAPETGEVRDDLRPGIRQVIVGSHVIYYRATPGAVSVLRLIHGARNMPEAFFEQ